MVLLVTHGGKDGIVSDARQEGGIVGDTRSG